VEPAGQPGAIPRKPGGGGMISVAGT
jgi:hypothetical protein